MIDTRTTIAGELSASRTVCEVVRSHAPIARPPRSRRLIIGAIALAAMARSSAAEPTCPARVELTGDASAIAAVRAQLGPLGVEVGAPVAGCRAIGARVELDEGGIAVAVVDGARRSEGRVVSDAAIAAAWIDSWLRDDLDGSGWLMATPRPRAQVAAAPPVAPPGVVAAAPAPSVLDRIVIGVAYEQSWTDDGIGATGFTGAACVRVGRACVGARARYARDAELALSNTAMARSDLELLAIATTSFEVGRMTVAPELGIGVGRRSTRRIEGCVPPPPMCMANDPMCNPDPTDPNGMIPPDGSSPGTCSEPSKFFVGDGFAAETYTPRFAAGLRVSVPLFDHVWLEGTAGGSFAPFGHVGAFAAGNVDPTVGLPSDAFALPGEPSAALHLAVGVRVEAR